MARWTPEEYKDWLTEYDLLDKEVKILQNELYKIDNILTTKTNELERVIKKYNSQLCR